MSWEVPLPEDMQALIKAIEQDMQDHKDDK